MHESEEVEEKFTAGLGGENGGKTQTTRSIFEMQRWWIDSGKSLNSV